MTAANISIYTDSELKARAQSVLADLGLDMTTAINAFLTQVVDRKAMPFEDLSKTVRRMPKFGCMKGEIWMADDFDAPLEDFPKPRHDENTQTGLHERQNLDGRRFRCTT